MHFSIGLHNPTRQQGVQALVCYSFICFHYGKCEINKEDVYYGGFAFCGKAGDVEKNFPISSSLNKPTDDGTPYLGRVAREFFKKTRIILAG